ncbi:hypothetical protein BHE74_00058459, partial [Ensete ventricosum]
MQCLCNFLEIQPFLQARDGAVLDRTSERWENFPCERRCRMCSSRDYVGFNMRKVTKGNVTIKLWDLGGQPRFRSMWERYCRGVSAIVYALYLLSRMLVYLILFRP